MLLEKDENVKRVNPVVAGSRHEVLDPFCILLTAAKEGCQGRTRKAQYFRYDDGLFRFSNIK